MECPFLMVPETDQTDPPPSPLGYCTPTAAEGAKSARRVRRIALAKKVAMIVGACAFGLAALITGSVWWDWHADRVVREWITWVPPDGDTWGGWDTVIFRLDEHAPKSLLDALQFANFSTGRRKF
jgi:hypothetical protein